MMSDIPGLDALCEQLKRAREQRIASGEQARYEARQRGFRRRYYQALDEAAVINAAGHRANVVGAG